MNTRYFQSVSVHRARRTCSALALAVTLGTCLVALTACSHMPWHSKTPQAPKAVSELLEFAADGVATNVFPQYWKRNTLVVDLLTASSSGGQLTLKPRDGAKWPVRIAFRVMPGTLGLLEVQADQRLLMPVTRDGNKPVDLELVAGVYTPKTPQITVKWEALKPPPT
jgi:hypothetical protein